MNVPVASGGAVSSAEDRAPVRGTVAGTAPVLDLRGLRCPLPVLKSAKHLADLAPGARLEILADDPLAAIDLPLFFRQEEQTLLAQDVREDGGVRFLVERGPRRPRLGED